ADFTASCPPAEPQPEGSAQKCASRRDAERPRNKHRRPVGVGLGRARRAIGATDKGWTGPANLGFLFAVAREEMLSRLVPSLMGARYFDDVASALLESMFLGVEETLSAQYRSGRSRVLRGVVHFRPEGSYQRLFGIERATGARVEGVGYLTSGNIW